MSKDKCFVIMPFGTKPIPEEPGNSFDFDKIYRTIIRRAVNDAGMEAIRADEQTGSHIIHSDMFRELRDRTVVLADLSLGNPNVYYELGIRHVLSPGGTVLICKEGSELPFDIKLSRVIFYKYNGIDIDWEEVESVVPQLKDALVTAKEQKPDSPVHALLEKVYPDSLCSESSNKAIVQNDNKTELTVNHEFEKKVANLWLDKKENIEQLIQQYKTNLFGLRALGELCLLSVQDGNTVFKIAEHLYFQMQYDLSYKIIKDLESHNSSYIFTPDNFIKYGSVVSERQPNVDGAEEGIILMKKGLALVDKDNEKLGETNLLQLFHLHNSIGGLYRWKWQITNDQDELSHAIDELNKAIEVIKQINNRNRIPVGRVAQLHIRLLILERMQNNSPEISDLGGHLDSILKIARSKATDEREASYLRWYKIVAYADMGNEYKVRELLINAIQEDKIIDHPEVGGAQYAMIRRFINNNLPYLRNHTLMGLISQDLQYAAKSENIR